MKDDVAVNIAVVRHLKSAGFTVREAALALGVAKSTVHFRGKKTLTAKRKQRVAKRSTAVDKRRALVKKLALAERRVEGKTGKTQRAQTSVVFRRFFPSVARIARELRRKGFKCSDSTVRRDLKRLKLTCRVKPRGPQRKSPDFAARRDFARAELKTPELPIFSDESMMDVNNHGAQFEWCLPGQAPKEREYYNFATKVHVWGAIGIDFRMLVFLPDTAIDAATYKRCCLQPLMKTIGKRRLMQDGARCHTKNVEYLQRKGVRLVQWPPRSPDANPIESLWGILKKRVSDLGPSNATELKEFVLQEWNAIPMKTINSLVKSYHSRLRAIVAKRGATITAAERRALDRKTLQRK
jgi:transposase